MTINFNFQRLRRCSVRSTLFLGLVTLSNGSFCSVVLDGSMGGLPNQIVSAGNGATYNITANLGQTRGGNAYRGGYPRGPARLGANLSVGKPPAVTLCPEPSSSHRPSCSSWRGPCFRKAWRMVTSATPRKIRSCPKLGRSGAIGSCGRRDGSQRPLRGP